MKLNIPILKFVAVSVSIIAMAACGNREAEPEVFAAPETYTLYACGIDPAGEPSRTNDQNVLFTEEDIEWFDAKTREIKFRDSGQSISDRMMPFREIEFRMGDDLLFVVGSFVGLWDSRVFTDLVLCYGNQETLESDGYYLYDCYPLQFSGTEEVRANAAARAGQWDAFMSYLRSQGKLR